MVDEVIVVIGSLAHLEFPTLAQCNNSSESARKLDVCLLVRAYDVEIYSASSSCSVRDYDGNNSFVLHRLYRRRLSWWWHSTPVANGRPERVHQRPWLPQGTGVRICICMMEGCQRRSL